jgi:hypothetical protein
VMAWRFGVSAQEAKRASATNAHSRFGHGRDDRNLTDSQGAYDQGIATTAAPVVVTLLVNVVPDFAIVA